MFPLRSAIAHVLGLDPEKVRCVHFEASGCYGHNGGDDASLDAAALAMHYPGRPVRLQWERADEMTWEPYGSAMQVEISADLIENGRNFLLRPGPVHFDRLRAEGRGPWHELHLFA